MKKVLVTGGGGFLGSHLCQRLINDGHTVFCLDNFITGSEANIEHLADDGRFHLLKQDVIDKIYMEVDEIYNLACPASPPHYQADPVRTIKTSFLGALNMLELAKQVKGKIFHASTSEVYGDPDVHPQPESYWGHVNPIGIRACYDEGKRGAETLCFDFHRQYGVKIKVGRIFNTYGPNMDPHDGRVVSNFIVQALSGQALTVYGNGGQTRSFCYCDDLIEAFVRMMNSPDDITGPFNLGNPEEFTILELAERIRGILGSNCSIVFKPLPQDDPRQRRPDISLASEHLGWRPQVRLEEGLKMTIEYFDRLLSKQGGNI
ncbi:NAD-dependent dehydratase (plasmid) [Deltaproteobacteria bacterium Smac51]|nr:NAD-dependent dehydratase [Deltaproteobacteria bacterium Smac51]